MSTPNLTEIGKIVREMQSVSLAKHLAANNFNQAAANIVTQGAEDKMRARGWPVGTRPPEVAPDKKVM